MPSNLPIATIKREQNCWTQDGVPLPFTAAAKAGDVLADFRRREPDRQCRIPSEVFGAETARMFGQWVEMRSATEMVGG